MSQQNESQNKRKPDFNIHRIIEIEGRDKSKFYEVGVGFINQSAGDGSINLMILGEKYQLRVIEDKPNG